MKKLKYIITLLNDFLDPTSVSKYIWIMLSWSALLAGDVLIDTDKIGATICVIAMLMTTVDFIANMRKKNNAKE